MNPGGGAGRGMFNRLGRLMSFLSQAMALAGRVRVMRRGEEGDILVFLTPDQGKETGLSAIYEAAAAAARLADGRLFIGEGNTFIQYRDGRAPRGYDAPDFKSPPGKDFLLLFIFCQKSGQHIFQPGKGPISAGLEYDKQLIIILS